MIAESFGGIFYANCFQNGLLPIRIPVEEVAILAAECANGVARSVHLDRQQVTAPSGRIFSFDIDPSAAPRCWREWTISA